MGFQRLLQLISGSSEISGEWGDLPGGSESTRSDEGSSIIGC